MVVDFLLNMIVFGIIVLVVFAAISSFAREKGFKS